jgi:type I restriction enzyme S subunit
MEVKTAYKQTEVGIIPEDWTVHSLRACLSAAPDYGINASAVPFSDKLPTYLRITDISEDGKYSS